MAYSAYNAYLSVAKTTMRDAVSDDYKQQIINGFFDSPSSYLVDAYTPSTPLSSTSLDCWITDNSDNIEDLKNIAAYPDQTLNYGDIVYWTEKSSYWLVTQSNYKGGIYYNGSMQRCLSSLKWLDDTKIIREAWFTFKAEPSRQLGINDGNIIIQPSETRYLFIQQNQYTLKIKKGNRFIVDGRGWRVTSNSSLHIGLVYLELQEADIDTVNDNMNLRICDYYNNIHDYSLIILNGSSVSIESDGTVQLNVEVKDGDNIVSSPSLIYTSSDANIFTVSNSGLVTAVAVGSGTVTVSLTSDTSISDTMTVNVVASVTDTYSISITGSSICKLSQNQSYISTVYNNGSIDNSKTVTWNLYANDGVSTTTLATIANHTGTSVTIKGNSDNSLGNVVLKATLADDNTVTKTFNIAIKSLF